MIVWFNFSEESSGKCNDSSSCSFLKKLWKIVGSNWFQSIWWGDAGNRVVIAEKVFKREVLGRKGPLQTFETNSPKTFIHQLNLHGFSKMEEDSPTPSLFYYNLYFKIDYPHLLQTWKPSAGVKTTAPAAFSLDPHLKKGCLRRSPDTQPGALLEQ
ncbi:LOW QUALITY PROTEIN: heat shock transcription factor, Y-linked-like [Numenius arquata]|uniref:LOW QUALITY PROTEIN: heat shock transcription factor, Y-linked-like n=1 Tax=Numenius arquata TaxID=31919 RepID=UPI003D30C303